jgi:hypothetical protein
MTRAEIEAQFFAVVDDIDAEAGDDEYFRCVFNNVPCLFKLMSLTPPSYMFKLRMKEFRHVKTTWPSSLPPEYSAAQVGCDIEDEYIFIWVQDATTLDHKQISFLVSDCISKHKNYFPEEESYCFNCGRTGSGSLIQFESSVATVCETCLEEKTKQKKEKDVLLNTSNASFSALLPIAVLSSSAGWAVFWLAYDAVFKILNTERIWAPQIVFVLVIFAVAIGLGWPVGKMLHRSGATQLTSPIALSITNVAITIVVGELMFASFMVHRITGGFDLNLILRNTLPLAFGSNAGYSILKFIFAFSLAVAVYEISKPKTSKLDI